MSTTRRSGPKTPYDGEATRQTLMDAAERLFANEGVDSVSIRAVNAAAGLAPAAVHYHFGSKDGLLDAVLNRRGEAVMAEVVGRAKELEARDEPVHPRELLAALVLPHLEMIAADPAGGTRWMKVIVQQEVLNGASLRESSRAATEHLQALLHRAFPDVEEERLETSWSMTVYAVLLLIAQRTTETEGIAAVNADQVLNFGAGGFVSALGCTSR